MNHLIASITILYAFFAASAAFAQKDIKSYFNHPLALQYKGSKVVQFMQVNYDEYELATGQILSKGEQPRSEKIGGKITTIIYKAESNEDTVLQVYKNFEHALSSLGVKTIFSCSNDKECGERFIVKLLGDNHRTSIYSELDPRNVNNSSEYSFLTGKLERNGGSDYLTLLVEKRTYGNWPVTIVLDVVESKNMELDLIMPTALDKKNIKEYFDHPLALQFKRSHAVQFTQAKYDEYELATGQILVSGEKPPVDKIGGKITTIIYETDTKNESVLQVYANFEQALNKLGVKTIFMCSNDKECGERFIPKLLGDNHRTSLYSELDPRNVGNGSDYRFMTGKFERNGRVDYLTLLVENRTYSTGPVHIVFDVIETKNMELNLVN